MKEEEKDKDHTVLGEEVPPKLLERPAAAQQTPEPQMKEGSGMESSQPKNTPHTERSSLL